MTRDRQHSGDLNEKQQNNRTINHPCLVKVKYKPWLGYDSSSEQLKKQHSKRINELRITKQSEGQIVIRHELRFLHISFQVRHGRCNSENF